MSQPDYYTVTLTPESRFFFGGEVTFGQAGENKRRQSYLVKSRVLPQQTSLLGMLRYELLRENSLLAPYKDGDGRHKKAKTLVGNTGFSVNGNTDYGVIQQLSPVLLTDGTHHWSAAPLDDGAYQDKPFAWKISKGGYWRLKHYNPKEARYARMVREDGAAAHSLDDCFAEVPLVGNRISNRLYRPNETSEEDEEGLFRQTFRAPCQPKNGQPPAFAFVFRVETSAGALDALLTQDGGAAAGAEQGQGARRVFLGAERSSFWMTVAKANDLNLVPTPQYQTNTSSVKNSERIVFTSDCYLPPELLKKCQTDSRYFLFANVKSFRFLTSRLDQSRDFASLNHRGLTKSEASTRKAGQRRESELYQLTERGGVLIVPTAEVEQTISMITSYANFHAIGYNHCAVATLTPKK